MALGKPVACVNVGMDAIFMFISMCVGGTSVYLCIANEHRLNLNK